MSRRKPERVETNTRIGQHFMMNRKMLDLVVRQIPKGAKVIEIGAGLGQLTEGLAEITDKLTSVEIDGRFEKPLREIQSRHPRIDIRIGNALKLKQEELDGSWIVGNIPYHITEPLITKISRANSKGAILLVGDAFAQEATVIERGSGKFGKLSMLIDAFFRPTIVSQVSKEDFDPPPRTDSAILKLEPKEEDEKNLLIRRLFLTSGKSGKVKNVLRESLIRNSQEQMTKNQARKKVADLGIPKQILDKPFEQLNNREYEELYEAIRNKSI